MVRQAAATDITPAAQPGIPRWHGGSQSRWGTATKPTQQTRRGKQESVGHGHQTKADTPRDGGAQPPNQLSRHAAGVSKSRWGTATKLNPRLPPAPAHSTHQMEDEWHLFVDDGGDMVTATTRATNKVACCEWPLAARRAPAHTTKRQRCRRRCWRLCPRRRRHGCLPERRRRRLQSMSHWIAVG